MDRCLQAALKYREWGWSSIAACNPKHLYVGHEHCRICKSPGKVPANLQWKYWQDNLPDVDEIKRQFDYYPGSNVCVVTGRVSGIIGVDIDGSLEDVKREFPWLELPRTITFRTHRGMRFIYEYRESGSQSKSYKTEKLGIDILSNGKQTIMPPSSHNLGSTYTWLSDCSSIAPFPNLEPPVNKNTPKSGVLSSTITEGERNERLFKAACGARRHGAEERDLLELVKSMNTRCKPPLDQNSLLSISRSAARYSPTW